MSVLKMFQECFKSMVRFAQEYFIGKGSLKKFQGCFGMFQNVSQKGLEGVSRKF